MIDRTTLRLNNWVVWADLKRPKRVDTLMMRHIMLTDKDAIDFLSPLELTYTVLTQNLEFEEFVPEGWVSIKGRFFRSRHVFWFYVILTNRNGVRFEWGRNLRKMAVQTTTLEGVHELQNLYRDLTSNPLIYKK